MGIPYEPWSEKTEIQYEKSSGGIVYRKSKHRGIEILLLRWLNGREEEVYAIPKGHIEEGEVAKDTAIREISEEAGLEPKDLEVIKFMTKLNYTFTAGHLEEAPIIDKDVYLFLVKYNGKKEPVVQEEERFVGYRWCTLEEIQDIDVLFDIQSIIGKNRTYFI
ncbi:NUDIX domain-containing protein [Candidatus Gracilibacteria bacterium]|nr:NUDIX domain-containing protein [Candidatus Gracilibacteria bacterium]